MGDIKGKHVFVGLSGGVDSAVSAALLKRAGAKVTGVFIKGWYPPGLPCSWTAERRAAMRVAARLQIPFRTLDASAEYKQGVIDYLLAEYAAGRTPNPDVMCNREVKFGAFYRYAKEQGADTIATGHYRSGQKDQSYFLWAVPKEVLNTVIFSVGGMEKEDVRKLAKRFDLPVAEKRDSQGICFLGDVSVDEFLKGEFGNDNPALLYTLGQRVPFQGGPWYVTGKDVSQKKIEISHTRPVGMREVVITGTNWFGSPTEVAKAQYRYRGPFMRGHVSWTSDIHSGRGYPMSTGKFVADEPLPELPAPGQSLVLYDDSGELVGGGIITA